MSLVFILSFTVVICALWGLTEFSIISFIHFKNVISFLMHPKEYKKKKLPDFKRAFILLLIAVFSFGGCFISFKP